MNKQPEALRLADELEMWTLGEPAAAELRRLYQLCMDQQGEIYALKMARSMEQKTAALVAAAEREACAKVCLDAGLSCEVRQGADLCFELSEAIRARGDTNGRG